MLDKLRIAIVWYRLPNYANACIAELLKQPNVDLYIASIGCTSDNILNTIHFFDETYRNITSNKIINNLSIFKPDVLVASGWSCPIIMDVVRWSSKMNILKVCAADTPWLGSLKQMAKILLGRKYLNKLYDVMWVPGERGTPVARMAGYNGYKLWKGLYSANDDLFSVLTKAKLLKCDGAANWPKEFIFVGRLVPEKNIDGMVKGYLKYREMVEHPWPLRCIGDGPLRHLLENLDGIICDGWLDSNQIASLMACSGAFVLPSTYEPWGVVVHEACCNGLPLILSTNVGAGSDLLKEQYNGISFNAADFMELAYAFKWMTCHPEPNVLGRGSFIISSMLSTKLWAKTLVTKSRQLLNLT